MAVGKANGFNMTSEENLKPTPLKINKLAKKCHIQPDVNSLKTSQETISAEAHDRTTKRVNY